MQRVRSGGEDAQLLAARMVRRLRHREVHFGPFRSADPIGLHRADRLGPVEPFKGEKLIRVVGDFEEPLRQVALRDLGGAAPADTIHAFDLFARQRHLTRRAPVHWCLLSVGDTLFVELQEDPLVPAEVGGVTGDNLFRPIERSAHAAQLAAHVLHVRHRPLTRMNLPLDGGVLRRQAEGVEANGVEDVEALHPLVAGQRVGWGLHIPVTNVQVAGWVWPHREQVVAWRGGVGEICGVETERLPVRLPARLNLARIVSLQTIV